MLLCVCPYRSQTQELRTGQIPHYHDVSAEFPRKAPYSSHRRDTVPVPSGVVQMDLEFQGLLAFVVDTCACPS
jgi:hypothetical protein